MEGETTKLGKKLLSSVLMDAVTVRGALKGQCVGFVQSGADRTEFSASHPQLHCLTEEAALMIGLMVLQ